MQITVKLFATLREGRGKVLQLDFTSPVTPKDIIANLNISANDVAILLINGLDGKLDQILKPDDIVSIFPPVGGG